MVTRELQSASPNAWEHFDWKEQHRLSNPVELHLLLAGQVAAGASHQQQQQHQQQLQELVLQTLKMKGLRSRSPAP
jgi:hypothetical protein